MPANIHKLRNLHFASRSEWEAFEARRIAERAEIIAKAQKVMDEALEQTRLPDFRYVTVAGGWGGLFECKSPEYCMAEYRRQLRSQDGKISADLTDLDLTNANLNGRDLTLAVFHNTILRFAQMRRANLKGKSFRGCNLQHANLREANLTGCDLSKCDLRNADLSGAILVNIRTDDETFMNGTDVKGVDFTRAWIAKVRDLNGLRNAKSLESAQLSDSQKYFLARGDG